MVSGFGVGLRSEFLAELPKTERSVDWLEVIAENWTDVGGRLRRQLGACRERWAIVPHGVTMSVAGADPLSESLFTSVSRLCRELDAPFWSDHICCAVFGNAHVNDLLPVPSSDEALEYVIGRVRAAQAMTEVPLVFENPTYYVELPGRTMTDARFLSELVHATGVGLLLDVNNVYVNSRNHGFDPEEFVRSLPLNAVRQIHVAGHTVAVDVTIDTHIGPVPQPVWDLYRFTLQQAQRAIPTLIEWDSEIPSLDVVLDEVDRARAESALALESRRAAPEAA
ncbi:MAG: DUF692 domain-containing protein [Myxococcales bacterium]|nr:DUF692 domain-containing protein [Myxococcales bacterium]